MKKDSCVALSFLERSTAVDHTCSCQVAICRQLVRKPETNNDLCCAASRYFKYVVPFYSESLSANLAKLVVERLEFTREIGGNAMGGFCRCLQILVCQYTLQCQHVIEIAPSSFRPILSLLFKTEI